MQLEVNIKNIDEFKRLAKKAPQLVETEFSSALNKIAAFGEKTAVETANKMKIHSTGYLQNSIRQKRISKLAYAVVSGAPYSIWVELGRKPGSWPPRAPIEEWVKRHHTRFSSFKSKGSKGAQKDIRNAAFLIQRAIFRKGTKPRPYMQHTLEKMQARADRYLDQALANVIKKL